MYFLIALVITLEDFVVHHEPVKFDHESELERRLKDSKRRVQKVGEVQTLPVVASLWRVLDLERSTWQLHIKIFKYNFPTRLVSSTSPVLKV